MLFPPTHRLSLSSVFLPSMNEHISFFTIVTLFTFHAKVLMFPFWIFHLLLLIFLYWPFHSVNGFNVLLSVMHQSLGFLLSLLKWVTPHTPVHSLWMDPWNASVTHLPEFSFLRDLILAYLFWSLPRLLRVNSPTFYFISVLYLNITR